MKIGIFIRGLTSGFSSSMVVNIAVHLTPSGYYIQTYFWRIPWFDMGRQIEVPKGCV